MKNQPSKTVSSIDTKVKSFVEEQAKLLKKHKLTAKPVIAFPKKSKVPFWGKVGMWLVRSSGGIIDTMFKEITK